MENNEYNSINDENRKLGGGIITICVLHIIGNVLALVISIMYLIGKKQIDLALGTTALQDTMPNIIATIVLALIMLISVTLLLLKKKIGLILYYISVLINLIVGIIMSGFNISNLLLPLVLPILLAFLVKDKLSLFGIKREDLPF